MQIYNDTDLFNYLKTDQEKPLYVVHSGFFKNFHRCKDILKGDMYHFYQNIYKWTAYKGIESTKWCTLFNAVVSLNKRYQSKKLDAHHQLFNNRPLYMPYHMSALDIIWYVFNNPNIHIFTTLKEAKKYLAQSIIDNHKIAIKQFKRNCKKYKMKMLQNSAISENPLLIKDLNRILKAAKKYQYKLETEVKANENKYCI